MYGSYISSRMLNTFRLVMGQIFSASEKGHNLHIKDKRPAPRYSEVLVHIDSSILYVN